MTLSFDPELKINDISFHILYSAVTIEPYNDCNFTYRSGRIISSIHLSSTCVSLASSEGNTPINLLARK